MFIFMFIFMFSEYKWILQIINEITNDIVDHVNMYI